MAQDHLPLKRPLLFDVQRTRNAPIALVNQQESKRLALRSRTDDSDAEARATEPLPASALPMLRSPRPEKPAYVPSPSKTPSYFRWKPKQLTPGNNARPSAPHRNSGPRAPSPRLPTRPSGPLFPLPAKDLQQVGQRLFEAVTTIDTGHSIAPVAVEAAPTPPPTMLSSRRESLSMKEADLFEYGDLPTTPATPATRRSSIVDTTPPPTVAVAVEIPPASPSQAKPTPTAKAPVFAVASPPITVKPTTPATPPLPTVTAPSARPPTPKLLESPEPPPPVQSHDDDQDTPTSQPAESGVAIEFAGSGSRPSSRQPQEKAIAQHVLRGKFLRRYLHANNLTRKLKETEQALRSAALHGGIPTLKGGGSLFSRSFISKAPATASSGTTPPATPPTANSLVQDLLGEEATALLSEQLPVLRRLSSIDKAINKTVKRIRRLSGIEEPAAASSKASTPSSNSRTTKFSPLKAIGEHKQVEAFALYKPHHEADDGENDEDEDEEEDEATATAKGKLDPSSAHMMRICQHVIATRAIKSFLRQELSVITIIEIALRDDTSLMPAWLAASSHPQSQPQPQPQRPQSAEASESPSLPLYRVPIKAMRVDMQEAVRGYLREGDQHWCLEEIYALAMQAERDKLWKRAILLASVCVVLDREFLHGVLLRARCCRRLGLWTQAIKDLSHAILLRPTEYKLVLLRACLYAKMGDLDNALVDANRALAFFPKCIDALLLRADIFNRQHAIGSALQDLTTALLYDPGCWRAYYDRASIRIRAIEGDEHSFSFHWEHMKYEKLLASIIEDYVNAVRKGCQMVEVVETIGDLSVRLLEFTGDSNVLRQVVNNLTHLLQILAHDTRRSFVNSTGTGSVHGRSPSIVHATVTAMAAVTAATGVTSGLEQQRSAELARELLIAALHAQRGRLHVLLQDATAAFADFDQAVVTEYHYPVAHFYRGAFATLTTKSDDHQLAANLQHINRCISLDPTIAGAFTVRGALSLRDLKFNSALQDFKAAVATDPTLYEVWLQIALIYLNHYHDSEACIKACTSALTNDSCLARALYLRAEAYSRQGNIKAALRDYGRLTIAQPDDRWAQLMRGRLLLQMKLARPALYAFIQFMELGAYAHAQRGTVDKRAHLLCGRAYKILSRFQQAVDQFQRAVSLNPTSENLVLLSESLHSMGDTENSLRVSEKVIHADPNGYKGYVRRAQLLVTIGQFQQAMAEYDRAVALAPKEGRVLYERGIVQMQLYLRWRVACQLNFDKPKAVAAGSASTAGDSKRRSPFEPQIAAIEVEATLGTDAINDEKTVRSQLKATYAGAIADFSKCMRLEPLMSEPYVDRAELLILGEDYDRAFADFHAAIERNPRCVRAYVNLGVLKCQFMAFAAAIADFDQAIRYDSRLALAFFNRAVCYHKLQLWRHADSSYTSCISLCGVGRDIDAHRNRAIARCHNGVAFQDALADFDEVKQSAPDDDQLHGGLGYVLLQLGRYEDAATCFATYGRLNRDTFADSGNAYFNLAASETSSHVEQRKYDAYLRKALRFYLRATRLHPSNLDLRLNLANCLRRMGEYRRAITQCEAINVAKPLHHASLESKALCFYHMHKLDEAVECMNGAIRACVASSAALENIFYAFAHKSIHRNNLERKTVGRRGGGGGGGEVPRPPTAKNESMAQAMSVQLQQLREKRLQVSAANGGEEAVATTTTPTAKVNTDGVVLTGSHKQLLALYLMNRGIVLEKKGAWDEAVRDYRDAIHFDPLSVQPLLCMATLLLLRRQYDDSLAVFDKALALEPRNGLAHLNRGVVCLCLRNVDEALRHFDAAIQELPACSYAYANRAAALAMQGELKLAKAALKRAIEELPSRKEYYLARGKIIAQQKRLQDAMVDFSTALYLGYEGKL